MGSEQNNSTSFSPLEPNLCVNGCGFFGTPSNMNMCSKCYGDIQANEEQTAYVEKSLNPYKLKIQPKQSQETSSSVECMLSSSNMKLPKSTVRTRCLSCNKSVGVTGFKCKCESTFCGAHRYPESHDCEFDFKGAARNVIAKVNPVVKADKMDERI